MRIPLANASECRSPLWKREATAKARCALAGWVLTKLADGRFVATRSGCTVVEFCDLCTLEFALNHQHDALFLHQVEESAA